MPASATITAEIPVVATPKVRRDRTRPERRSEEWYATRRRPAPYVVRLGVWLLSFLLLCVLAGAAVEHYHPTWLDFLRNTAAPAGSAARGSGGAASRTSTSLAPTGFHEISRTAKGATYSVPAASYSLVVATSQPCWTQIATPAGSSTLRYAQTVQPSSSPKSFTVTGSSSVTLDASATSLAVRIGGTTVGTINAPTIGPFSYSFVPTGS